MRFEFRGGSLVSEGSLECAAARDGALVTGSECHGGARRERRQGGGGSVGCVRLTRWL